MSYVNVGRWMHKPLSSGFWLKWAKSNSFKKLGLTDFSITGKMMVLDGHFLYDNEETNELVNLLYQKIVNDDSWFELFFSECKMICAETEAVSKQLGKKDLVQDWIEYSNALNELHSVWTLAYLHLDKALNKAFAEYSSKSGMNLELLSSLVKPKKTRLMLEKEEALTLKKEIYEKISKENNLNLSLNLIKNYPELDVRVRSHFKKFGWVGLHHFEGKPLSFSDILEVTEPSLPIVSSTKELPIEAKRLLDLAGEIAYWRQYLAESSGVSAFEAMNFFKTSAEKVGLDQEDYCLLAYFEYIDLLKTNKTASFDKIYERKITSGAICEENNYRIVEGDVLQNLVKNFISVEQALSEEVSGSIACKGIIKGKIKVLMTAAELVKIEPGDILVTTETTPTFAPIFKKIKGIITDHGGITSHAAIISREFNIPCLVGTKNATLTFKDGDLVELNAITGIARKVKI